MLLLNSFLSEINCKWDFIVSFVIIKRLGLTIIIIIIIIVLLLLLLLLLLLIIIIIIIIIIIK